MDMFNNCRCQSKWSSPLILVSYRLPFRLEKQEKGDQLLVPSSGGLVTALLPIIQAVNGTWIGCLGDVAKESGFSYKLENARKSLPYSVNFVHLSKCLNARYYNDVCNSCLWPLFHSLPERATFENDFASVYKEANSAFARETASSVARYYASQEEPPIPVVWIHDYHLLAMPKALRKIIGESTFDCHIAFFLHIPFPSIDILRMLPGYRSLLKSLLACDLVGFQTEAYAYNFISSCMAELNCYADQERGLVLFQGRSCRVGAFPIAIPFASFERIVKDLPESDDLGDCKIILGVDRLDYTKGLLEKLKAFEHFLRLNPEYIESVILIQVAVPTRESVQQYQELKQAVDREVGRINGQFSTLSWSPIKYLYRSISRQELALLYRKSNIAAVTPIRDGMNLVAKEFVACQSENPGVLILSKFTGSAETMTEAIIVNPHDKMEMSDAFRTALEMSKGERKMRMESLKSRERRYDVHKWFQTFIECAVSAKGLDSIPFKFVSQSNFDQCLDPSLFRKENLMIFLDYDGTLAPIANTPSEALFPEEGREILRQLNMIPAIKTAVITGRSVHDVKSMVNLESIIYAGNHGLEIIGPLDKQFKHPEAEQFKTLIDNTCQILETEIQVPGGWVEKKGLTLAYHYRQVKTEGRGEIVEKVIDIIRENDLVPKRGKCVIEGVPYCKWNKGDACLFILKEKFGKEWEKTASVIFVGDDVADEDAFEALKNIGITFKVVSANDVSTAATFKLCAQKSVYDLLKWILSKCSQ